MAQDASSFVRDWISGNVENDPFFDGDMQSRIRATVIELKASARSAGIEADDPEMADDLLRDQIQAQIENTSDPTAGFKN